MKNEYTVTWELLKRWTAEDQRHGLRLGLRVMWCVLAFGCLCIALFFAIWYPMLAPDENTVPEIVVALVIGLFCLYRGTLNPYTVLRRSYKELVKEFAVAQWVSTTEFRDDKIVLTEGTAKMSFRYSDVERIRQTGNYVILYCGKRGVLRVYTDCFTEGDWDSCKALLLEKNPAITVVE